MYAVPILVLDDKVNNFFTKLPHYNNQMHLVFNVYFQDFFLSECDIFLVNFNIDKHSLPALLFKIFWPSKPELDICKMMSSAKKISTD